MSEDYSAQNTATVASVSITVPTVLRLDSIHRWDKQPRQHFDEGALATLAFDIAANGVMHPIVVRMDPDQPGTYLIVVGERRWRAAQMAGQTLIPATIRDYDDGQALERALAENEYREQLGPIERARAFQTLAGLGRDQTEIGRVAGGKSQEYVSNHLRLLKLPASTLEHVEAGRLSYTSAVTLCGIAEDAPNACMRIADIAAAAEWTSRQVSQAVKVEQDIIHEQREEEARRLQPSLLSAAEEESQPAGGDTEEAESGAVETAEPEVLAARDSEEASPVGEGEAHGPGGGDYAADIAPGGDTPAESATDAVPGPDDSSDRSDAADEPEAEPTGLENAVRMAPAEDVAPVAGGDTVTLHSTGDGWGADEAESAAPAVLSGSPDAVRDDNVPPGHTSTTPSPAQSSTPVAAPVSSVASATKDEPATIQAAVRQSDDDFFFEQDLTLTQALDALRAQWPYRLSSLGIKCLKALTDTYNGEHADTPLAPAGRLELLLKEAAEAAGYNIDTLESIPE